MTDEFTTSFLQTKMGESVLTTRVRQQKIKLHLAVVVYN